MTTLENQTAGEWLAQIRSGAMSAQQAVEHCIARIESVNPAINAVVARDFERARDRARAADAATVRGAFWGPLHGLPVTIKDSLETEGLVTTSGAPALRGYRPKQNAVSVQRLVDAGAIILGKTNLPLYAGDWQSDNAVYGRTNNPWNPERTVGGSSGGAAAALAAGLVPLELGSDIAGSIRTPAHYCGVYGHKPTHGIVPVRGHIPGPPGTKTEPDLAVVGPMARSAADLELALDVLAGPDVLEAPGWRLELPPARAESLKDFRVGVWLEDPLSPLDAAVRRELEATIKALRPHARIVDVKLPFALADIVPMYTRLLMGVMSAGMPRSLHRLSRVAALYYDLAEFIGLKVDPVASAYARGMVQSHEDWVRTHEARNRLRWRCNELFQQIDVLLTPVVPITAFSHQTGVPFHKRRITINGQPRPYLDHIPWIALATLAGLPATSAPVGVASDGLPVNLQIIGPALGDRTTLRFAQLMAQVRGGFQAPPII
jgi:amidase